MKVTVTNKMSSSFGLPAPFNKVLAANASSTFFLSTKQEAEYRANTGLSRLRMKGSLVFTTDQEPVVVASPVVAAPVVAKVPVAPPAVAIEALAFAVFEAPAEEPVADEAPAEEPTTDVADEAPAVEDAPVVATTRRKKK